jgi:N-methylhydantoinase A
VAELAEAARSALGEPQAEISATYELRYRGQAFELAVGLSTDATPAQLRAAFEEAHEERYGYRDDEQEIELVTVRASATAAAPPLPEAAHAGDGGVGPPGSTLAGPTVVPLPESTVLIPEGWRGTVLADGAIELRKVGGAST